MKLQALRSVLGNGCCPALFSFIMSHFTENNDRRTEYIEEGEGEIYKTIILVHICLNGINLVCQLKKRS